MEAKEVFLFHLNKKGVKIIVRMTPTKGKRAIEDIRIAVGRRRRVNNKKKKQNFNKNLAFKCSS